MPFEQARDVIDHARDYHQRLGDRLRQVTDESEKGRIQLLLMYLSRHEDHLGKALADYELGAPDAVLDTWFQTPPRFEPRPACDPEIVLLPHTTVDELTRGVLQLHECLREVYREGAERADVPEVREAFANLAEHMRAEERQLSRDVASSADL